MSATTLFPVTPKTLRGSLSFYMGPSNTDQIMRAAQIADAVTIAGANGPKTVEKMRRSGFGGTVIFDRAAYETPDSSVDASEWFDLQEVARADRLFSPGRWVP